MIPPFDDNGNLPPGIHTATLLEIERRYTYTLGCKRLSAGLKHLVYSLKRAGCTALYLDGSYITNTPKPGDYDATWEFDGVDNRIDWILRDGTSEQVKRKYLGDVFCRMPDIYHKDHLEFFQTDRNGIRKGIIKVDLRQPI